MKMKIGIVLPQSTLYPLIGHQFTNGLRSCAALLEIPDIEIEFVIKDAGLGDDRSISEAANMLILQDQVDVITGLITNEAFGENRNLFHQTQVPVIAANLGAKVQHGEEPSPYMFCTSLNLWQSCYFLGKWAVETYGKKTVLASSFYDGGYSMGFGFSEGFMGEGGELMGHYITAHATR